MTVCWSNICLATVWCWIVYFRSRKFAGCWPTIWDVKAWVQVFKTVPAAMCFLSGKMCTKATCYKFELHTHIFFNRFICCFYLKQVYHKVKWKAYNNLQQKCQLFQSKLFKSPLWSKSNFSLQCYYQNKRKGCCN